MFKREFIQCCFYAPSKQWLTQKKLSLAYGTIETPFRYGLIRLGYTREEDEDLLFDKYSIDYAYIHTKNQVSSIHFGTALLLRTGDEFSIGLEMDENLDCVPCEIRVVNFTPGFMGRKLKIFGTQQTNDLSYKLLI